MLADMDARLTRPDGSPVAVAIVEDEAVLALDIEMLIQESGGLCVGTAASAEQAIRLVATTRPDVVIMDVNLRGPANGIDAATIIRENFSSAIVFVTAMDAQTYKQLGLRFDSPVLTKPADPAKLLRAIRRAIDTAP